MLSVHNLVSLTHTYGVEVGAGLQSGGHRHALGQAVEHFYFT